MPRWLEITLTLVLFAAGMAVVGWAVNASVPGAEGWLVEHVGNAGFWGLFTVLMIVCSYFAWRGHRPNAGRAAGK